MESFNWKVYLSNYPDLQRAKIHTKEQAWIHYCHYGLAEGRTDKNTIQPLKITVITPCTRPQNLQKMFDSLDFNYIEQWIIVYDYKVLNSSTLETRFDHPCINEYYTSCEESVSGNYQRNYALSKIKNENCYIYFLDDDNIIHPELYTIPLIPGNFYSFDQERENLVFQGNCPRVYKIDSAMVLIYYPAVKEIKWSLKEYHADGIYIQECYRKLINRWIYINKITCYYNKLNEQL
jgi:hypothetical protein